MRSTDAALDGEGDARADHRQRAAGILAGDKALYVAAVKNNLQVYSKDGIVSAESQKRSLDFLKQFDKEIAAATSTRPRPGTSAS